MQGMGCGSGIRIVDLSLEPTCLATHNAAGTENIAYMQLKQAHSKVLGDRVCNETTLLAIQKNLLDTGWIKRKSGRLLLFRYFVPRVTNHSGMASTSVTKLIRSKPQDNNQTS